jgi:crotonobetainyl-CoA:carnitine CoA-transferase CaiB-like acyl-CoA transferase
MLPLADVRIVTMALNAPGPVAAAHLRAAGARVTKVEPPTGDPLESYVPAWYRELHEGVIVERIDLKSADGVQRMRALLADADLFLASQRPSALARLGLDAESLLHEHSNLRHLRWLNIVGELDAPEVPGHDLTYLAKAGLLGSEVPKTVFADVLAAEHAYATALLLLRQPPGSRAQVGLYDSLAPLVAPLKHGLTGRGNLLGGRLPAYGIYDTRDGRIAIAALEPHFRRRLYEALDLPLDAELTAVFVTRTAAEWEEWASVHDVPIAALTDSSAGQSPQRKRD